MLHKKNAPEVPKTWNLAHPGHFNPGQDFYITYLSFSSKYQEDILTLQGSQFPL